MKRVLTIAVALMIASVAFGQKSPASTEADYGRAKPKNPLVSEQNYKHPFAAAAAKKTSTSEKYEAQNVLDAQDYKHPHNRKSVKRVRLPQGDGTSPAASHKHPLGL